MKKKIVIGQPFLPELSEFIPYLENIWKTKTLTNIGPFHTALETALCKYLGVEHISLFTNGTIALMTALRALEIKGEVITTPYSFVGTTHAIVACGLTPIFIDVSLENLNLDPLHIEEAITPKTAAIMPVHCYGYPCDHDLIKEIADKHKLKLIYDSAHAFGVYCDCGSILNHGDLSVLSFHATKVFNTFEGGAIVSKDRETKLKIDLLKNFGYQGEESVACLGLNGKLDEIRSAFGLLQLRHIDEVILKRRTIDTKYRDILKNTKGIRIPSITNIKAFNYAYFPIFIEDSYPISRDALYTQLRSKNVFARKYFYPLISDFEAYRNYNRLQQGLENARLAAATVLCLPIHADLSPDDIDFVCTIIRNPADRSL